MILMVGLGNPGKKYHKTRHNVGFMVIDRLVKNLMVSPHVEKKFKSMIFHHHKSKTIFARPLTSMNRSGIAVGKIVKFYKVKPNNLFIIHDDLDIKIGEHKVQKAKGPKDHKGLDSVYKHLGNKDFWHVRVGVENRLKNNKTSGEDYVLQNFTKEENKTLEFVFDKIIKDLNYRLTKH